MISKQFSEEIISAKDTQHICANIIAQYQKAYKVDTTKFEWVYLVYGIQDDQPIVFYLSYLDSITALPKNRFSSYVSQVNQSSFAELLYLVSHYGAFIDNEDSGDNLSLLKDTPKKNTVQHYFESTFGKLLYHYQLEQLYCSLTQSNAEEAIAFRREINVKRQSTFEKAKMIALPTGENLFEVITQNLHNGFTTYPNIKEAIALHSYLNQ